LSSFYLQKQFCAGATDVINGGVGVKRQKKPVVVLPPSCSWIAC
jgi:hypothetical protein